MEKATTNKGSQSETPPHVVLMRLAQGMMISKALQAVAELGLADLLVPGPGTVEDLAQATSTHAPSLFRLLRALASRGIFRQNESGGFEQTALSEPLRSDHPASVRDYVIYAPHDGNLRAWMNLMSVLRTGAPSFAAANGCDMWEYFRQKPEIGERFNCAMTSLASANNRLILQAYDFSPFRTIIDVGGGQGLLLATILKAYPHLRGTVFDLASVAEGARRHLQAQGIADRCEFMAGDAFTSIPAGFDAYLMKNVLHDWDDDRCVTVLKRCRAGIPSHGKLIIADAVMVSGNEPHPAKWFDLHMMVALGGRERTEAEFRSLLSRAGFTLTMVRPLPAPIGIVEAVPSSS